MLRIVRFSRSVSLILAVALAACGVAYGESGGQYQVRGVIDAVKSHVSIFINGDEVIHQGILDLSTRQMGKGTISETDVSPLKGTYQGKPVEVSCYNTPWTSDIYCQIQVSNRLVKTLTFYQPSPDGNYRAD